MGENGLGLRRREQAVRADLPLRRAAPQATCAVSGARGRTNHSHAYSAKNARGVCDSAERLSGVGRADRETFYGASAKVCAPLNVEG